MAPPTSSSSVPADLVGRLHGARAAAGGLGAVGLGLFGMLWGLPQFLALAAVAGVVAVHALQGRARRRRSVLAALLVDATALAGAIVIVRPPGVVAVPVLAYLVVAAMLLLRERTALGMVWYAVLTSSAALAVSQWRGARWELEEVVVLTAVVLVATLPLLTLLGRLAMDQSEQRHRLSRRLREREERERVVAAIAFDAIVMIDEQSTVLYANPAVERIFGWSPGELVGKDLTALIPEQLRERHRAALARYTETGERTMGWERIRLPGLHRQGREVPLEISFSEMIQDGRRVMVGVLRDVSERAAAERKIAFQASLLDQVRNAVVATDPQGRIVYWNRFAERLYGWCEDEVLGRDIVEVVVPPAETERAAEIMAGLAEADHWEGDFLLQRKDGSTFLGHVTDVAMRDEAGRLAGVVGVSFDISERRAVEERYRNLFANAPVALWEEDFSQVAAWLEGLRRAGVRDVRAHLEEDVERIRHGISLVRIRDINPAAVRMVGAPGKEELLEGLPAELADIPAARRAFLEEFVAIWEGRDYLELESAGGSLRGEPLEVMVRWAVGQHRGRPDYSHVVVAITDITDRKRSEAATDRRLRWEQALSECSRLLLTSTDDRGLEQALEVLAQATGVWEIFVEANVDHPELGSCSQPVYILNAAGQPTRKEHWDMTPWAMMPAAHRRLSQGQAFLFRVDQLEGEERRLYQGGTIGSEMDVPIFVEGEWVGLIGVADPDPDRSWKEDEVQLFRTVAGMIGAFWERQRARERLEELVRSKDDFVASISHELRTPLTAVVGLAEELRDGLDLFSLEEVSEFHRLIADQAREVANIVEDLLVAARVDIDKVSVIPAVVEVSEQVESVLAVLQAGGRIGVGPLEGRVWADPTRVRQILRNLLTNALRYGGEHIRVEASQGPETVTVVVRDDGPGIPHQERDRIFEPYYRAQAAAGQPASVGLGLFVSRQLARLMGGDLRYRSEGGESVFELVLPEVAGGEEREPEGSSDSRLPAGQVRRLLARAAPAVVFQPIVDLERRQAVGVEALARFESEYAPSAWFAAAGTAGLRVDLELAAARQALAVLERVPPGLFMAVNLSPETLEAGELGEVLASVPLDRLVVEVPDRALAQHLGGLEALLAPLREAGLRVAVDDVGATEVGLWRLLQLQPDLLKVDGALTRGLAGDASRAAVVGALVRFAEQLGSVVVAEAVEGPADLEALSALGVRWGQGYHLGHPQPLARLTEHVTEGVAGS